MGMFDTFRDEGWNTYYAPKRNAASHFIVHYIIGYFSIVAVTALFILVISSRGKERWGPLIRLIFNLHTAISILFCITGQEWLSARVRTRCFYSPGLSDVLQADIGLHIGLKGINITFIVDTNSSQEFSDIYYNEEFSLFGSADVEHGLHSALHKGLPYPLLYVVEYLGVDAGGLRWSRNLRMTGHFAYIMLWSALALWVLAQVLQSFVITRSALLNLGSGLFMMAAVFLYHGIQPETPLIIPFPDGFLQLEYGWCYWLICASGIHTILYSVILLVLYQIFPELTSEVLLCDAVWDELKDRETPSQDGLLQIMTPFNERKKMNLERCKNYFDNKGFVSEDDLKKLDRYNNRRCSVQKTNKTTSDSNSSVEVELELKRTFSSPAVLEEALRGIDNRNVRTSDDVSIKSWEVPPDYSESEDELDTDKNPQSIEISSPRSSEDMIPQSAEDKSPQPTQPFSPRYSEDKIPEDKIPEDKIPEDKIPEEKIPEDKIPKCSENKIHQPSSVIELNEVELYKKAHRDKQTNSSDLCVVSKDKIAAKVDQSTFTNFLGIPNKSNQ